MCGEVKVIVVVVVSDKHETQKTMFVLFLKVSWYLLILEEEFKILFPLL